MRTVSLDGRRVGPLDRVGALPLWIVALAVAGCHSVYEPSASPSGIDKPAASHAADQAAMPTWRRWPGQSLAAPGSAAPADTAGRDTRGADAQSAGAKSARPDDGMPDSADLASVLPDPVPKASPGPSPTEQAKTPASKAPEPVPGTEPTRVQDAHRPGGPTADLAELTVSAELVSALPDRTPQTAPQTAPAPIQDADRPDGQAAQGAGRRNVAEVVRLPRRGNRVPRILTNSAATPTRTLTNSATTLIRIPMNSHTPLTMPTVRRPRHPSRLPAPRSPPRGPIRPRDEP